MSDKKLAELPHYAAVNIKSIADLKLLDELFEAGEPRILIDACTENAVGGTGKQIDSDLITEAKKKYPLWLAGGITEQNIEDVKNKYAPVLVDVASGVEAFPGKKDGEKLRVFFRKVNSVSKM